MKNIEDIFKYALVVHVKANIIRQNIFKFIFSKFQLPIPTMFENTVDFTQLMLLLNHDMNLINSEFDNKLLLYFMTEYKIDIKNVFDKIKQTDEYISKSKQYELIKNLACILSHLLCIYYAKLNNWPYVLVLEDDACPCKNAKDKLTNIIQKLDLTSYDAVILLGYTILDKAFSKILASTNQQFVKISTQMINNKNNMHFCGLHSYIVPNKLFNKILNSYSINYNAVSEDIVLASDKVSFSKDKIFCQLNFPEKIQHQRVEKHGIKIYNAQNFEFPFSKHQLYCIQKAFCSNF